MNLAQICFDSHSDIDFSFSDASAIKSAPGNQVVLEGNSLTLHCNASGNPSPNITWTRDKSSSVLPQGNIYNILNIHRDATGYYTCTAWNGVGEQQNATAVVTVLCEFVSFIYKEIILEYSLLNSNFFCCKCTSHGKRSLFDNYYIWYMRRYPHVKQF